MSIPLIQKPEKDDINTSIIAIKRNIERINMLLGLSNSEEIDTSKFATKEELQQAVTDLQPVDEVAVDNMHSVTSNAVANYANKVIKYKEVTLTNITMGANGYYDIRSSFPNGMNNFLFASMYDFGSVSSKDALGVNGNGNYLFGTENATITTIVIRYYYTD